MNSLHTKLAAIYLYLEIIHSAVSVDVKFRNLSRRASDFGSDDRRHTDLFIFTATLLKGVIIYFSAAQCMFSPLSTSPSPSLSLNKGHAGQRRSCRSRRDSFPPSQPLAFSGDLENVLTEFSKVLMKGEVIN